LFPTGSGFLFAGHDDARVTDESFVSIREIRAEVLVNA
jgi:hypothetical protein